MSAFTFPDLSFDIPEIDEQKPRACKLPIYTADLETDPFHYGRYPLPFVAGMFDGTTYTSWWGPDCVARMFDFISALPHGLIYFHYGGKFDIYYCMKYIRNFPALIINGRIVRCFTKARKNLHEIRDSYAIMPFPLAKYKKTPIDYGIMEANLREIPENRREITNYLGDDCRDLWTLCKSFIDMFGPKLTVGQTAMGELRKFHAFENLGPRQDNEIRSLYYYGGRVQCFKRGILKGAWKVYDVNSMYPYVMRDYLHPIETPEAETRKIRGSTCFVTVEGRNYGAFPVRTKSNGLRFDIESGTFHVSIHEFNAALDCGLFEPTRIRRCINFRGRGSFAEFVNHFYESRNKAKNSGDDIHVLFYKYVLNSAYGKFAQDSSKYYEYTITDASVTLMQKFWKPIKIEQIDRTLEDTFIVWSRKPEGSRMRMYNVAAGSSITGAARAVLMRAIHKAKNPIYCDTDSIICEDLPEVSQDASELGAWKLEAQADTACIAMKKLYALFAKGECVKQANKGVAITAEQIRHVAKGGQVTYRRDAPSYHLNGTHSFIERTVVMR